MLSAFHRGFFTSDSPCIPEGGGWQGRSPSELAKWEDARGHATGHAPLPKYTYGVGQSGETTRCGPGKCEGKGGDRVRMKQGEKGGWDPLDWWSIHLPLAVFNKNDRLRF